jgi:hypothetical protein
MCGSTSTAPALQVQSLEFKPQFHQKTKTRKKLPTSDFVPDAQILM